MQNALHIIFVIYRRIIGKGRLIQHMSFHIKSDKKDTENKTIRFPVPLILQIEDAIRNHEVSFSGFVIQACEYALEHMDAEDSLEL